jgi:serine/threonine protein kinase
VDTLGRYTVLGDQTGAVVQPAREGGWRWQKAFNHALRCYAALSVIPKAAFPTEQSREQFEREVLIAKDIRHRNVASIFPLEVINDRYLYAMEFCDGETVAARTMRSGGLETLEALNIAQQIAAGLEAASSAGILYRNITPDNIMVLEEDDELAVKVLGLALPAAGTLEGLSPTPEEADFRSPEEIAGKTCDVRSGIYSLGALLYFMEAGLEKYEQFRARSMGEKRIKLFRDEEDLSYRVNMVVRGAACQNPKERIATFAELVDAIDQARIAPEPPEIEAIAVSPPTEVATEAPVPPARVSPAPELPERAAQTREPRPGELTIPVELLSVAQPGTVLRLNRVEATSRERVVAFVGDTFCIGRATEAQLVTRFQPRTKANDAQTRRLSKIHVTLKCEGRGVLLSDGSGVNRSANGSAFDGKRLSTENPIRLIQPGELKLADAYSIKIIPVLEDANGAPAIANLKHWNGPGHDSHIELTGAILFMPNEKSDVNLSLWLFSAVAFGVSSASRLDFTSSPKIAALRYFRGCFWIEQRSTEPLLLSGLALGRGEIAPLAPGQTLEVKGSKYAIEFPDLSKQQKLRSA